MNAIAHTSVRLATLATLVVGLAVAPAAAAPEPESVSCNQAPRPAPVCSIEKAAPIYHARPVLATHRHQQRLEVHGGRLGHLATISGRLRVCFASLAMRPGREAGRGRSAARSGRR